jgi:hypothetical protein
MTVLTSWNGGWPGMFFVTLRQVAPPSRVTDTTPSSLPV